MKKTEDTERNHKAVSQKKREEKDEHTHTHTRSHTRGFELTSLRQLSKARRTRRRRNRKLLLRRQQIKGARNKRASICRVQKDGGRLERLRQDGSFSSVWLAATSSVADDKCDMTAPLGEGAAVTAGLQRRGGGGGGGERSDLAITCAESQS